jgi:hypothetical protein
MKKKAEKKKRRKKRGEQRISPRNTTRIDGGQF